MAKFVWTDPAAQIIGNADTRVSNHLKCYIRQGDTYIVGVIGDGASKSLQANWDSPFEADTAEQSSAGKIIGLYQVKSIDEGGAATGKSLVNSMQIWNGNQPVTMNLPIQFYALHDPLSEVVKPVKMLEKMHSPQVEMNIPISLDGITGRSPGLVSVCIGRHTLYPRCIIESITIPQDMPVDRNGHWLEALVDVQIQTHAMINRSGVNDVYR